jgi:hypothetical protein
VVLGGAVVLQQLRVPGAEPGRECRPRHISRAPDERRCRCRHAAIPVGGVVPVSYRGISIAPAKTTVKAGTTIKWTNFDATLHNVAITSGPVKFSSPAFKKSGSYKAVFARPGVYHYLCTFHPGV